MKKVNEIIDLLNNRKGFGDWWWNIDDDLQKDIKRELKKIIIESN